MEPIQLLLAGGALLFVGGIIYVANVQDATGQRGGLLRWMLYGVTAMILYFALNVVTLALLSPEAREMLDTPLPELRPLDVVLSVVVAVVASGISFAVITFSAARVALRRVLSTTATYDADSSVHLTAVVLSLMLISITLSNFALSGGLTGLANVIEAAGISSGEVVFQGLLFVIASLLGVGMLVRRGVPQTLARLGLRVPTREDLAAGIGGGSILFIVEIVVALVWAAIVAPELFEEQTLAAEQIQNAINSLPLVLIVSLSAAVGEETFFRGAMQPVFGLVPTSLFFAAIHTQYTLTPAVLIIVIVAFGMGYLRTRYSTTAAVIAHFVYNFILLMIAWLGNTLLGGG